MIHSLNSYQIPVIAGIPATFLLMSGVVSLIVYLVPKIFRKIFPLEPDTKPFWHLRNRIAKFENKAMRKELPQIYHFFHSSLKDNLYFVIFWTSIIIYKKSELKRAKFLIACSVVLTCSTLDTLRNITYFALQRISLKFVDKGYDKAAKRTNEFAMHIRPSLISGI